MEPSLWDAIARVERRHWWFRGRREIIARVLEQTLPPGAAILDVGCGTGFVLERLAGRFDALGVEPDESVRARAAGAIRNRLLPGGIGDFAALGGRRFDAVLLLDVLEHLDDDLGAVRQVRPVIAPGGMLLIAVPANPALWSRHDVLNEHHRRYTAGGLRFLLESADYSVDHIGHMNSRLYPLARLHRLAVRETTSALRVPPRPLNAFFAAAFAGEARRGPPAYSRGLSLLAIARPRSP